MVKLSENDDKVTIDKVRVAFFNDILVKDFDGAVKTMYQLINRIDSSRFDYLFFCGMQPKQKTSLNIVKVPSIIVPFNISYRAALPGLSKRKLLKKLNDFNPDVIHISTPSLLGFFALKYAKENNIPVLAIYHTHFISYMKYYFKIPFIVKWAESFVERLYRKFYNNCDVVYVPTHFMMRELVEHGISKKVLKQWHRGLDTKLFNPGKKNKEYIKNITGNYKPCILYASRIVWEKNIETLFNIYDKVVEQNMSVNFIIAGDGAAEPDARQRMPNAIFLGKLNQDELGTLYASSDIFVFPSISESYGNVVVEATACGCISVIARGGGSQALVDDGKTGFLCEPNDASDYIDKIRLLLNDDELKRRMQAEGSKYISLLSWESLAKNYFNDIEQLAKDHSK